MMTFETMSAGDIGTRLAEIAVEAARVILPLWRSGVTVETKADDSPVTIADKRAEALILDRLNSAFPGVPIVSEEDAAASGVPLRIGPRFFLVDPLDGTKAFIRGDPNFTVNIALIEDGRPAAGAVVAPPTGEVWRTSAGGAWKGHMDREDGGPIRVRPWRADQSLALISHTMKPSILETLRERYGFSHAEPVDSSIKLCRIAEGSADIYARHGTTMEWDIAAGHAVLAAAGGALTTSDGEPFLYGKTGEGFRNGWFVARGAPSVPA